MSSDELIVMFSDRSYFFVYHGKYDKSKDAKDVLGRRRVSYDEFMLDYDFYVRRRAIFGLATENTWKKI